MDADVPSGGMPRRLLWVTLAGDGHLNPTLPLVAELVRRGHTVDYATGAEYADAVTGVGARWVELPPMPPFLPSGDNGQEILGRWLRHYFHALRATYPALREHVRGARPDVICYDTTNWPARVLAEKLGIPAVRSIPNVASNESFSLSEQLPDELGADHPVLAELTEECAAFSGEHGVELDLAGTLDAPETLNLVLIPREFQPSGETFDESFHFLGPSLTSRFESEQWSPREPNTPLAFTSLGSILTGTPEFYRTCVKALTDPDVASTRWQLAMTVRDLDPAQLGGELPPRVDIRPWFPQLAVLRRAEVFITHAGMNSVLEALACGVGMVALPETPEQATNADRLQELGLGERLDTDALTPQALHAAVTRVATSAEICGNLARMRAAVQRGGGAARGADLIERHTAAPDR